MKIIVFSQRFYPEVASINEVACLLTKRGHKITIMTALPNAPAGKIFDTYGPFKRLKEKWNGVDIRRNWLIPKGNGSNKRLILTYISFVISASIMLPRLRGKKPDVIFVNQLTPITKALPAILYKKITGAPLVMWVHDIWPESVSSSGAIKNKKVVNLIGKMVNYIYKNCDHILIQSKAMQPKIEERGVAQERITYLPNPIDKLFKPISNSSKSAILKSIPSNAFIVMFAGSIGRSQDITTIIQAAEILKDNSDIYWVFVGGGSEQKKAKNLAELSEASKNISFTGNQAIESMPNFYNTADVMLVTLRNEEIYSLTVPLKIQGYLACAKPIICNIPGEAARIINEANAGFTSPPEDPEALANAVLKAYKIKGTELNLKGQNARAYFNQNYTQVKIIDILETTLQELSDTDNRLS